jgi:hypothetical protein
MAGARRLVQVSPELLQGHDGMEKAVVVMDASRHRMLKEWAAWSPADWAAVVAEAGAVCLLERVNDSALETPPTHLDCSYNVMMEELLLAAELLRADARCLAPAPPAPPTPALADRLMLREVISSYQVPATFAAMNVEELGEAAWVGAVVRMAKSWVLKGRFDSAVKLLRTLIDLGNFDREHCSSWILNDNGMIAPSPARLPVFKSDWRMRSRFAHLSAQTARTDVVLWARNNAACRCLGAKQKILVEGLRKVANVVVQAEVREGAAVVRPQVRPAAGGGAPSRSRALAGTVFGGGLDLATLLQFVSGCDFCAPTFAERQSLLQLVRAADRAAQERAVFVREAAAAPERDCGLDRDFSASQRGEAARSREAKERRQ